VVGVFINYRGDDSDTAGALIDRELTARFGSDQVFFDNRSIPAGTDFVEELLGRLRTCSVLLVVIGPQWLTLTDGTGQRRIDNSADWVRREIAEALSLGLHVIPVLLNAVKLPTEADLPADIAGLSRRQYVSLRRRYTLFDLAFLVERIIEADKKLAKVAARHQPSTRSAPRRLAWVPIKRHNDVSLSRPPEVGWNRAVDEQVVPDPTLLGSRIGLPDALAGQAKPRLAGRLSKAVEALRLCLGWW